MELKGSVAIVTGGASGLGEATVISLLSGGSRVAILDVDTERGETAASNLGTDVIFCHTDVTNADSVENAIGKTTKSFGTVHLVINCAGVGTPMKVIGKEGPISIEKFNQVVQVNLIGTMNVIRLAAVQMVKNDANSDGERGVVINTASIAAFEGQIGQAAYASSKAGVVGMTLPIAREFADYGIRVVTIVPGIFQTPMMDGLPEKAKVALSQMMPFPKRLGKPSEFAMLVRQIIENTMLNGAAIRLDAALRMSAK